MSILKHLNLHCIFPALPEHATLIRAECTFDRDSCAWRNTTTGDFEWRMAAVARRPANLPDKTYGAPVGYAYFDIFSHTGGRSNKVRMISPTVSKGIADHMCFSFWFAAFGAGDTTSLRIYRQDVRGGEDNDDNDDDDNSPTVFALKIIFF